MNDIGESDRLGMIEDVCMKGIKETEWSSRGGDEEAPYGRHEVRWAAPAQGVDV